MNRGTIVFLVIFGIICGPGVPTLLFAKDNKIQGTIALKGKSESEYSALAKVSLADAIATATKDTSGKVIEAALDKKDGFLVYEIDVQMPNHIKKELWIDAGSGKILLTKEKKKKSHDDDEEEDEDDE